MCKFKLLIILTFFFTSNVFAQVGIRTPNLSLDDIWVLK